MRRSRLYLIALLLTIAAAAGIVLYERSLKKRREIYVPQEEKITPEVVLLRQYVRIDTSNPPGKEAAGARWIVDQLKQGGIGAEIIESAPGRTSVYARLRGKRRDGALLLLSHIDVVPANPKEWQLPPFGGDIRINQLNGRGALDMKSTTVAHIEAMKAVVKRGTPERDVVLLAVADEETGGALGMEWLLKNRPDVVDGVAYALGEGGVTEMMKEQVSYFGIEVGTKLVSTAELRAPTREALLGARIALEPHFKPPHPHRILPPVRRFLASVAPQRLEVAELLADVDRAIDQGKFFVLPLPYRELTQNNVFAEAPRREGDGWAMKVLLINLPDEDPDARIRWLAGMAQPYGAAVVVQQKQGPAPISSEDTPLFRLIVGEVKRAWKPQAVGIEILARSVSDARFLRPRGIVCYGLQPFPVDFFQSQSIHGADERVRLDWFVGGVELMRRVVTAYAFATE